MVVVGGRGVDSVSHTHAFFNLLGSIAILFFFQKFFALKVARPPSKKNVRSLKSYEFFEIWIFFCSVSVDISELSEEGSMDSVS